MKSDPLITITDVRRVYCVKGARRIFNEVGIDFADFVKNGRRASELMGIGHDGSVERIVKSMESKDVNNGG